MPSTTARFSGGVGSFENINRGQETGWTGQLVERQAKILIVVSPALDAPEPAGRSVFGSLSDFG
jgi:hypothetical protein